MADPEVSAFGRDVLHGRNGGGGPRRIIAGSVFEPKAIMRNFHLDLELKEKKKRIDAAKKIHMRNMDHRKHALRTKLMEQDAHSHDTGLLRQTGLGHKRGKQGYPNMKLLLTLQDELHARKSDINVRQLNTSSCILHPTNAFGDVLPHERPRATTLESYFRQQSLLQHRNKLRSRDKLAPNQIQAEERPLGSNAKRSTEIRGRNCRNDRFVLPDIHEQKRASLDSKSLVRDVDSALSGRLSQSLDSLPRQTSPQPSPLPELELPDLPTRRVSRLRSVTIGRTLDLEGMLERQKARAAQEKMRRRSDEKAPDYDTLDKGNLTEVRTKDKKEPFRQTSYDSVNQYATEIEEADRMFRKCRFKETNAEHLDFDQEVSKISHSFIDA